MNFMKSAESALSASGPGSVLSGISAARLHGLVLDDPAEIDIIRPWDLGPLDLPGVRVHRLMARGRRPVVPEPLPHTDIVDTVLDLADRTDAETCVFWLTEAHRRGLVRMPDLLEALDGRRRHRHRTLVEDVAGDIESGATSNLEVRYVRHVERAHGLPRAVRQFIVPTTGHRSDFAYPEAMLLLETDGLAYHQGANRERDERLDAEHAAAGWLTLRFTWGPIVGASCEVAREIARAAGERGLPMTVKPCAAERAGMP